MREGEMASLVNIETQRDRYQPGIHLHTREEHSHSHSDQMMRVRAVELLGKKMREMHCLVLCKSLSVNTMYI